MLLKKILIACVATMVLFGSSFAQDYTYDYKVMKMDEYNLKLQEWQQKEQVAQQGIEQENQKIAELQKKMEETKTQTQSTWNEIYASVGTDEAGFNSFMDELNGLSNDVSGLLASSPDDIYRRMNEVKQYQAKVAEMKKDKRSLLTQAMDKIASIEGMLNQAIEKAKSANASYTVMRGDYLWKIAKNPDVYGNAFAWVRLWTANRNIIKNPNLIYPNQVLQVHRVAGPNEYVVQRGDFLYQIAKSSMGNAFAWQKIYEANRGVIGENPAVIYPHMVLQLPQ